MAPDGPPDSPPSFMGEGASPLRGRIQTLQSSRRGVVGQFEAALLSRASRRPITSSKLQFS